MGPLTVFGSLRQMIPRQSHTSGERRDGVDHEACTHRPKSLEAREAESTYLMPTLGWEPTTK